MPVFGGTMELGYVLILSSLYTHYCEIIATAAGNQVSKHLEVA